MSSDEYFDTFTVSVNRTLLNREIALCMIFVFGLDVGNFP